MVFNAIFFAEFLCNLNDFGANYISLQEINAHNMATDNMTTDLNRIKVVLVEKKKTNKWLAEQLGKDPATVSNGAPILPSQLWICWCG